MKPSALIAIIGSPPRRFSRAPSPRRLVPPPPGAKIAAGPLCTTVARPR